MPVVDVDPFQTVDPFAFQPGSATSPPDHDWFHPPQEDQPTAEPDPFQPVVRPVTSPPSAAPSSKGKAAPRAPTQPKPTAPVDPWGASTQTAPNNGHDWAQFSTDKNVHSPFEAQKEWTTSTGRIQYRVLFDYTPERPDEMAIVTGDIITVRHSLLSHVNGTFEPSRSFRSIRANSKMMIGYSDKSVMSGKVSFQQLIPNGSRK